MNRRLVIATSVVLLHLLVLWALHSGLLRRATEIIVPVQLLSGLIPPPPQAEPLKPPPAVATPAPRPAPPQPQAPAPQPLAVPSPMPAPAAPVGVATPAPLPALTAPTSPTATTPSPVPAPKVELPSSNAAYLSNPKPAYPALSRRLGEQGKVVVRVLIGVDGTAQQAEIQSSSGYERLDQAALSTALKWRYVPGRRGGVPEAMWFNVPISFVLE